MKLWKRNVIAAAIVLFVCGAVYLNWSYSQDTAAGKNLGEAALVGQTDPLQNAEEGNQDAAAQEGGGAEGDAATQEGQAAGESSYFSTARLNRQQARDSALTLLQEAAAGEDADQTMKDQANDTIQAAYKAVEANAAARLTAMLPPEMQPAFAALLSEPDPEVQALVKAADKLSAHLKCLEELKAGNREFQSAAQQTLEALESYHLPELDYFLQEFLPAFSLTLDELPG